jgi:ribA/ribD-fused uncharacterized protein
MMHRIPDFAVHVVDNQGRGVWAFFTDIYIASNMHYAEFDLDGVHYYYTEQGYQAEKAEFFGDRRTANAIRRNLNGRAAMTPKQMKAAARGSEERNPGLTEDWNLVKGARMRKYVLEKYRQNRWMREALFRTGDERCFEACLDPYWACGVRLGATTARFLASIGNPRFRNEMGIITEWARETLQLELAEDRALNPLNRSVRSPLRPAFPLLCLLSFRLVAPAAQRALPAPVAPAPAPVPVPAPARAALRPGADWRLLPGQRPAAQRRAPAPTVPVQRPAVVQQMQRPPPVPAVERPAPTPTVQRPVVQQRWVSTLFNLRGSYELPSILSVLSLVALLQPRTLWR